jgi:hypothetical protein
MTGFGGSEDRESAPTPFSSRKVLAQEIYYDLVRLADDGCPLVADLEEYDILEVSQLNLRNHLSGNKRQR